MKDFYMIPMLQAAKKYLFRVTFAAANRVFLRDNPVIEKHKAFDPGLRDHPEVFVATFARYFEYALGVFDEVVWGNPRISMPIKRDAFQPGR